MKGWLLLLAGLGGCTVSPVPEPPTLDPTQLDGTPVGCDAICVPRVMTFTGRPGAAPAGVALWGGSLDEDLPASTTTVAADGSFAFDVEGLPAHEFRLAVLDGASLPVDVVVADDHTVALAPRPFAACLSVRPEVELDFGAIDPGGSAPGDVVLENDCDDDVVVEGARVRASGSAFALDDAGPFTVAAGARESVRLTFAPAEVGVAREAVVLDVSAPERDRRAVMLVGETTE